MVDYFKKYKCEIHPCPFGYSINTDYLSQSLIKYGSSGSEAKNENGINYLKLYEQKSPNYFEEK